MVENVDYKAPLFEWMLTDTCGLTSTGTLVGVPSVSLTTGTSYNNSQSVYQGNAVRFNGSAGVYAYTSTSSLFNVGYFNTGFTMSGWYSFESIPNSDGMCFFEFGYLSGGSYTFLISFWLFKFGLYYYLS